MLRVERMKLLNGKVVDLSVDIGEILLLEGPNGAGKSLLLKSLAKLISSSWDMFEGADETIEKHRMKFMYLPPSVSFSAEMTVEEFFHRPFDFEIYKNFTPNLDFKKKASGLLGHKMKILSSGQRQFVALLRAMGLGADCLLLDEPFGHLDQGKRLEMVDLLGKWGQNKSIIIVDHGHTRFPLLQEKHLRIS